MSRVRCVVPFCRRTREDDPRFSEWICGDHWRMVPKKYRQVYGRFKRRWRRFGTPVSYHPRGSRLWERIKREAIERAGGI